MKEKSEFHFKPVEICPLYLLTFLATFAPI